jgi:hypothetical protein
VNGWWRPTSSRNGSAICGRKKLEPPEIQRLFLVIATRHECRVHDPRALGLLGRLLFALGLLLGALLLGAFLGSLLLGFSLLGHSQLLHKGVLESNRLPTHTSTSSRSPTNTSYQFRGSFPARFSSTRKRIKHSMGDATGWNTNKSLFHLTVVVQICCVCATRFRQKNAVVRKIFRLADNS